MTDIKCTNRPVFIASDGTEFAAEEEACAYQAGVDSEAMINAYLASEYEGKTEKFQATMKKRLRHYEMFKAAAKAKADKVAPVPSEAKLGAVTA